MKTRVEITGLQSNQAINGSRGNRERYDAKKDRYIVVLDSNDDDSDDESLKRRVSIRPRNLTILPPDFGKVCKQEEITSALHALHLVKHWKKIFSFLDLDKKFLCHELSCLCKAYRDALKQPHNELKPEPAYKWVVVPSERFPNLFTAIEYFNERAGDNRFIQNTFHEIRLKPGIHTFTDAAMTAKILQLANSAVFGLRSTVHTAAQAVTMLGVEAIKSLVLSFGIFREFENVSGFSIDSFMDHSLKVGGIARLIAISEALDKESINIAFTSGMLHDIGKLALLRADADAFQRCIQNASAKNLSSWEAEREIFGSDHAQVGAHMLFIWGLPQSIIEAVALHHNPEQAGEKVFSAITAVASANELCHKPDENADRKQRFEDYLGGIGCLERQEVWQGLCDA